MMAIIRGEYWSARLAAILCADVHGYRRLMGEDEEATLRMLTSHHKSIDSQVEQHHGRFVNEAGDGVLAEFASVVEAVNCTVEIQTGLKAQNASIPSQGRMEFRIGVNLGDVTVEGEQIYGDGMNVAARLDSRKGRWRWTTFVATKSAGSTMTSIVIHLRLRYRGPEGRQNSARPSRY
jgi:class 3 adenylate cyclase